MAPRTVQLGVVRTGGVEIVLLIIDRFYSDGSIGFYGDLKRVFRLVLSGICEFSNKGRSGMELMFVYICIGIRLSNLLHKLMPFPFPLSSSKYRATMDYKW